MEETREVAAIRQAAYNQMVKRYHDSKVKPRTLKVGDLVLRTVENNRKDPRHGKLGPNWEGPYRVVEVLPGNAFRLETPEGKSLPNAWNMAKLKFYFP